MSSSSPQISAENQWQNKYSEYLTRNGLKSTVQRDIIVKEFYRLEGHITAEELHAKIKTEHSSIGLATIYRTLKILTASGLALERHFNDGFTRYELCDTDSAHHDHIVCVACDKVEEFENDEIEELQKKIAAQYKFKMIDHKLEIYGLCRDCASEKK